uniref:RNase H type-1 domain-containing protein n=1 Tax=viral metagenome TaxID=1070528 RepID=A0A6C0BDA2_9ZZZZ
MSVCFTDASYDPKLKFGVIVYRIYPNGINYEYEQTIKIFNEIKNSELEKIGIQECINSTLEFDHVTIFTDCKSAISEFQNDRVLIVYIKGHTKKINRDENGLIFREIDILSRKKLRKIRKDMMNV